jgi:transcriptional regulator with XRE-family HTH domain
MLSMPSATRSRPANISGRRIQNARLRKHLDQSELAAALSVDFDIQLDQSDISEIERGVRGVKDFELLAIARVLEVDPSWLLQGRDARGKDSQ